MNLLVGLGTHAYGAVLRYMLQACKSLLRDEERPVERPRCRVCGATHLTALSVGPTCLAAHCAPSMATSESTTLCAGRDLRGHRALAWSSHLPILSSRLSAISRHFEDGRDDGMLISKMHPRGAAMAQ